MWSNRHISKTHNYSGENTMKKEIIIELKKVISRAQKIDIEEDKLTMDDILENIYQLFPNLAVISGNLFFWMGSHYEKLEDQYQEQGFFIKNLLKKLLGKKYIRKNDVLAVHKELLNDYHFPTNLGENVTAINMLNGILVIDNTQTTLIEHDEKYGMRYIIPYAYDPKAQAPLFKQFLEEVICEKQAINVLLEYMGYILLNRSINYETALLLYGEGRNGKSVLLKIMSAFIGSNNTSYVELQDLNNPNRVVMLDGKLVNIGSDSSDKNFDSSFFKKVISGEPVAARQLFKDTYDVTDLPRFVFAMNNLPRTNGDTSFGLIRRLLIIHFDKIIKEEDIDRELFTKLEAELSGILNLAIAGAQRLLAQGHFTHSNKIAKAVKTYEDDINLVKRFVEDHNIIHNEDSRMTNTQLYNMFSIWCIDEGIKAPNKRYLIKKISSLGFISYKNNAIRGFKILADEPIKTIESSSIFENTSTKTEHELILDKKI